MGGLEPRETRCVAQGKELCEFAVGTIVMCLTNFDRLRPYFWLSR